VAQHNIQHSHRLASRTTIINITWKLAPHGHQLGITAHHHRTEVQFTSGDLANPDFQTHVAVALQNSICNEAALQEKLKVSWWNQPRGGI